MSMSLMKKVITSIILAILKKGESFSQVWVSKIGLPCWLSSFSEKTVEFFTEGRELSEDFLEADGVFAHLRGLHAQKFSGVVQMDVAEVPTAWAGGALHHPRHSELLAVNRTVSVGRHDDYWIARLDLHAPGQKLRDQDPVWLEVFASIRHPLGE